MARLLTPLRVFVGSPSDVQEERDLLPEAIEELNLGVADMRDISLQLKRWEIDVPPDVGDLQEVIFRAIGDFDIAVFIFWKRLGTPTSRALSGTVEEFGRALEQKKRTLTYFKRVHPDPGDDPEQLKKLEEFKDQIRGTVLYRTFDRPRDFQDRVRKDLIAVIKDWTLRDEEGRLPDTEESRHQEADGVAAPVAYNLGLVFAERGDFEEAARWLRRGAERDIPGAAYNLGMLYRRRDEPEEAERWLRRGAEGGDAAAAYNLWMLYRDRGDMEDEAERWLRRGAQGGDPAAAYNLGMLHKGRSELDEAERWLREGAEGGDPAAAYNLGMLYRRGELDEAERWLREGAEGGDPAAAYNLGMLYRDRGDMEDEAERWLRTAAEGGDALAIDALEQTLERRREE